MICICSQHNIKEILNTNENEIVCTNAPEVKTHCVREISPELIPAPGYYFKCCRPRTTSTATNASKWTS